MAHAKGHESHTAGLKTRSPGLADLRVNTDCGACSEKCCTLPYDFVYMTEAEMDALSAATGLTRDEFVTNNLNPSSGYIVPTLNLPCRFLNEQTGECGVYEVRPLVCRLFPFYPDPFAGQVAFYPAQCGSHLKTGLPADEGWSARDYGSRIRAWADQIWKEARERSKDTTAHYS